MENTELHNSAYVDSLRLTARQHADLLHELDGRARGSDADRRGDERVRFTEQALLFVQIRHPGGTAGNYLVRTRNLSRTGIGFLHGSFVYSGTPCTVALRSVDKVIVAIDGMVVRCNHVRGHVHEIGVQFVKPIRLRQFLGQSVPGDAEETHSTELPTLSGRILYVDDSAADQDLFNFHVQNLGLECNLVTNALDALDLAESVRFDAVFTSTMLTGGISAGQLICALRSSGYQGPILGMTADETETADQAIGRGYAGLLIKPYRFEDLLQLLQKHVVQRPPATPALLVSELWSEQKMRPLIRRFLDRLSGQVCEIERLARAPESSAVFRKYCTDLKGSAGSYGYPSISRAAGALIEEKAASDLETRLDALRRLCDAAVLAAASDAASQPDQVTPTRDGGEQPARFPDAA